MDRLDQPRDPAAFARRGAASDARHDYACELAPGESSYFYQRGMVYWHRGNGDRARADFDQAVRLRADNADALVARAGLRALSGKDLEQALIDCNTALQLKPGIAAFLDSRGLVQLRRKNYDAAIADYDAALRLQPKLAWSLYGRGLAKLRKGLSPEGQADIAAATALQPKMVERAARYGITP